jgi:hypothetical protein
LRVPAIAGAADYRVFAIPKGTTLDVDSAGHESVLGTTIFCGGLRQHSAPAADGNEIMLDIEVAGLAADTRLVVEAIDTMCPFVGIHGNADGTVVVTNPELDASDQVNFSTFTEAEIVAKYGSMIINGHRPATLLGAQAEDKPPMVLARTTILAQPTGNATPFDTWQDDFSVDDPIALVSSTLDVSDRTQNGLMYQNSKLSFYTYGSALVQFFLDRMRLDIVLADWSQDIFASAFAVPRQVAQLSSTDYLHVHYRVASDSSQRRYWWFFLCGADTAGATMDATGKLLGNIIQTPFFYDDDGRNPVLEGWNCLQIFPRDGSPFGLDPGNTDPQTDIRVMVNKADDTARDGVTNVSPNQYGNVNIAAPSWYRRQGEGGALVAPILDDQLVIAPTAAFDLYVRRDRVILYVNGEQRLCNDFASNALTMAEAAVGFGQVLYHTSAEREEFFASYWLRSAQLYYLYNTPYADVRNWDDLGFTEHVAAPPVFDPSVCYAYTP